MQRKAYHVSSVRPLEDETLVSFLQRAQADGDRTDGDFQSLIAGAPIPDAWLAERRCFDWRSMSRFVNADATELHGMSQRSLFYALDDEARSVEVKQRAPWLSRSGYSAHCPCCIKESPHWRKSWTNPTAIVCDRHQTVLLRHCDECGSALDSLNWTQVRPICPNCHHHLSLNPVVRATDALGLEAKSLRGRFDSMVVRAPVAKGDFDLAHFAAVWRAAELLGAESNGLGPIRDEVLSLRGIRQPEESRFSAAQAVKHAENVIVAHLLTVMEPAFSQHFWMTVTNRKSLKRADRVVLDELQDIASSLSIDLSRTKSEARQLTMSFDNWYASNLRFKAA